MLENRHKHFRDIYKFTELLSSLSVLKQQRTTNMRGKELELHLVAGLVRHMVVPGC